MEVVMKAPKIAEAGKIVLRENKVKSINLDTSDLSLKDVTSKCSPNQRWMLRRLAFTRDCLGVNVYVEDSVAFRLDLSINFKKNIAWAFANKTIDVLQKLPQIKSDEVYDQMNDTDREGREVKKANQKKRLFAELFA